MYHIEFDSQRRGYSGGTIVLRILFRYRRLLPHSAISSVPNVLFDLSGLTDPSF